MPVLRNRSTTAALTLDDLLTVAWRSPLDEASGEKLARKWPVRDEAVSSPQRQRCSAGWNRISDSTKFQVAAMLPVKHRGEGTFHSGKLFHPEGRWPYCQRPFHLRRTIRDCRARRL